MPLLTFSTSMHGPSKTLTRMMVLQNSRAESASMNYAQQNDANTIRNTDTES